MNSSSRVTERGVRKRLLRLEAESYRLDMAATLGELRRPMTRMQLIPVLFGLFGGRGRLLGSVAAFLVARRMQWVVKSIPMALAGWRMARRLRGVLARPR